SFEGTTAAGHTFHVPQGAGVIGAIRAGLLESALVGEEHLNDTSDAWRSLTATYDTEELKAHPDDLLGVGLTRRVASPTFPVPTRRITVAVRARPRGFEHIRTRDRGVVTVGGQSLSQDAESRVRSLSGSVTFNAFGMYTKDFDTALTGSAGVAFES